MNYFQLPLETVVRADLHIAPQTYSNKRHKTYTPAEDLGETTAGVTEPKIKKTATKEPSA